MYEFSSCDGCPLQLLNLEDEFLELARQLKILPPRVRFISAPAASTDWGKSMSSAVQALVQPAARRVADLARQWLV